MFEDLEPRNKKPAALKDLTDLGVAELEEHIAFLKSEIERTEKEIEKKKAVRDRAASVFK